MRCVSASARARFILKQRGAITFHPKEDACVMRDEDVLLRLRRKWSKDEEFRLLIGGLEKALSERDILIGQQRSYIQELEDSSSAASTKIEKLTIANKELKSQNKKLRNGDIVVVGLNEKITELRKTNKRLQLTISNLVSKLPK